MRRIGAFILAGAMSLGLAVTQAAEPAFVPFDLDMSKSQFSDLGSNWYLRGDLSGALEKSAKLSNDLTFPGAAVTQKKAAMSFGAGYQVNSWFRTEATWELRAGETRSSNGASVICPYAMGYFVDAADTTIRLKYSVRAADTCAPANNASLRQNALLLSGYGDLGTFAGITPYLGIGAGFALTSGRNSKIYYKADGSHYEADLTAEPTADPRWYYATNSALLVDPQPATTTGKQNWDRFYKARSWSPVWALMAGFAYDMGDNVKLDLGYRYINLGSYKILATASGSGVTTLAKTKAQAHEIRAGFRYMID